MIGQMITLNHYIIPAEVLEAIEKLLERFGVLEIGNTFGPMMRDKKMVVGREYKIINPLGNLDINLIKKVLEDRFKMFSFISDWKVEVKQISERVINLSLLFSV